MEKAIEIILSGILEGGTGAVLSILIVLVVYLVWDRHNLIKSMQEQSKDYRTSMSDIIDKYQTGQINVIEALNEIKVILGKIEVKV